MAAHRPELIVITKTYDLVLWSCHHTSRFPRNHRFVLGERLAFGDIRHFQWRGDLLQQKEPNSPTADMRSRGAVHDRQAL